MDIRSQITRARASRRQRKRSNPLGTIALLLAGLLSVAAAGGVIYGVMGYARVTADLPAPEMMELLLDPLDGSLLEPTRIYDSSGETVLWQLGNPALENRQYLNITDGSTLFHQEVSEHFILAVLTALDPDYLSRPEGFFRGVLDNRPDPLPDTLVEELLLWDEAGHPYRMTRISLLADHLVARYGREKILEWFVNSAYFGNQIYGIGQAAEIYFGKSPADLDLSESALLAGVISYPSLNPYDSPDAAKENQEALLGQMAAAGLISRSEEARAVQKQLIYADPERTRQQTQPPYVDYLLDEASRSVPLERLQRGGFVIISTLDSGLQRQVDCTLQLMARRAAGEDPPLDPDCPASRLLPKYAGPFVSASDLLEMNLVLLDPLEARLLALGGYSLSGSPLTVLSPKNPGTLVTTYLYLDSFARGFEPASLIWDIPPEEGDLTGEDLHPGCDGDCDFVGPVNMRTALANDYLAPALQLWEDQGASRVEETLALFGYSLQGERCQECLVFPGFPFLDLIEVAQGYGVFVNQGFLRGKTNPDAAFSLQPAGVAEIRDLTGRALAGEDGYQEKKVISEQLAYLVNSVLSDETARNGGDVFQIGRPAGVKPGYVPGSPSAWVVGYTPQILTAVWAGDSGAQSGQQAVDYGQIASNLWRAITQHASREYQAGDWEQPSGMVVLDVCYPSGMLPTENCPREVREIFIEGNQPQTLDTLYQAREINRETGLLASVFTPAQLIEERVYLDLPPRAMAWAEAAGIAPSPTLYDLNIAHGLAAGLTLTAPENLSFVKGQVRLVGSIPEAGFQSARLQFGEGMNPASWLQIGEEIRLPGENQYLGLWDTRSLEDGVYALQLVVVMEGQQIAKTSRVVSVDNTPPQIRLKPDLASGILSFQAGKEILFEAQFDNHSEIARVEFYLNGDLLGIRETPPFIALWGMQKGTYNLAVTAYDLAGNPAQLEADFQVLGE